MPDTRGLVQFDGVHGYCARPEQATAGVILLPAIYGLDPFVRGYADALADIGLAALVWDPYRGETPPDGLQPALRRAAQLQDTVLDETSRCMDYMRSELRLSAVGSLGFCLGGRFVFLFAARDPRVDACAAFYPSVHVPMPENQREDVIAAAASIKCPVTMVYTRNDSITSQDTFGKLRDALRPRSAPSIFHLYPDAEHGFMLRQNVPANKAASDLAAPQVNAFLKSCLMRKP